MSPQCLLFVSLELFKMKRLTFWHAYHFIGFTCLHFNEQNAHSLFLKLILFLILESKFVIFYVQIRKSILFYFTDNYCSDSCKIIVFGFVSQAMEFGVGFELNYTLSSVF